MITDNELKIKSFRKEQDRILSTLENLPEEFGKVRLVWWTREMAEYFKDRNTKNRNRDQQKEMELCEDMLAGRWYVSNDALCISAEMIVTNGQTRNYAFLRSGLERIPVMIKWDAPQEEFKVMDKPRRRSNAVSNNIDKAHDEVCTFFYRLAANRSRTSVFASKAVADSTASAYSVSCLATKLKKKYPMKALRAAFIYAHMMAKTEEEKQLALDVWLIMCCEELPEVFVSYKEPTNMMVEAVRKFYGVIAGTHEISLDVFLKAVPVFMSKDQSKTRWQPISKEVVKENLSKVIDLNI